MTILNQHRDDTSTAHRLPREATPGSTPEHLLRAFPWLIDRLEPGRLTEADYLALDAGLDDFQGHGGGRGDVYRDGQSRQPLARAHGVAKLFDLVTPPGDRLRPWHVVADLLGGNGTLAHIISLLLRDQAPRVVTSDLSRDQVRSALGRGLPALRQPAQRTHFADGAIDGAVFAYGTHHIPAADRPAALAEANRMLRPGARVVVQDFEEGTPTARWYSEALDRFTGTGHDCVHFSRDGMSRLLADAGFVGVELHEVDDSFHIVGGSPEGALRDALHHVVAMFGMVRIPPAVLDDQDRLLDLLRPYFPGEPTVRPVPDGRYLAILPRVALVAVGTKPVPIAPWPNPILGPGPATLQSAIVAPGVAG
ncbi:MAG: methyltransferase domain-containing protein [Isosphaeraceae bacterium]